MKSKNIKNYCPICKKNNFHLFNNSSYFYRSFTDNLNYERNKTNNFICEYCGHIWQYPLPSKNYLSRLYSKSYRNSVDKIIYKKKTCQIPLQLLESRNSFLRAQSFFDTLNALKIKMPSRGNLLDIGGYQGLFAWALSSLTGLEAKVIDYNLEGLKFAEKFLELKTSIIYGDTIKKLNEEKDNYYQLITMIHSLEHLDSPERVISKSYSLLNDLGYLYIEVPNSMGSALNDPTHLHTFCKS